MIDCRCASFSAALQEQRLGQAGRILGEKVVNRILCFALYLLGIERSSIAELTGSPAGTVRSVVRAILRGGVPAFEDRRQRSSTFLPPQPKGMKSTVGRHEQGVSVDFEGMGRIQIPRQNTLQARVVLLTLLGNGLVGTREVSAVLGLSTVQTLNLARALEGEDIRGLIDKRGGQKQEYRFTAEVKAELIQQFVLDIVTEGRASGRSLSEHLLSRCELHLSERSVRDQLGKLGLSRIKESLPNLLSGLKKTPEDRSEHEGTGSGMADRRFRGEQKGLSDPEG